MEGNGHDIIDGLLATANKFLGEHPEWAEVELSDGSIHVKVARPQWQHPFIGAPDHVEHP